MPTREDLSEIFNDIIVAQSRNRILSSHDDNAGFYEWVMKNKDFFLLHFGQEIFFISPDSPSIMVSNPQEGHFTFFSIICSVSPK